jgi:uncharacterized UPF0160 family protein
MVTLDSIQSNKAIVDIILGDQCEEELKKQQENIVIKNNTIIALENLIKVLNEADKNLNFVLTEKNKAIDIQAVVIKNTESIARKEKRKKNFWKVTTLTLSAIIGVLLIK